MVQFEMFEIWRNCQNTKKANKQNGDQTIDPNVVCVLWPGEWLCHVSCQKKEGERERRGIHMLLICLWSIRLRLTRRISYCHSQEYSRTWIILEILTHFHPTDLTIILSFALCFRRNKKERIMKQLFSLTHPEKCSIRKVETTERTSFQLGRFVEDIVKRRFSFNCVGIPRRRRACAPLWVRPCVRGNESSVK